MRRSIFALPILAAALVLASCTVGGPELFDTAPTPAPSGNATSQVTSEPASSPPPTSPPTVVEGPCADADIQVRAEEGESEQLGGMTLKRAIDSGTRPYASGTVRLDASGTPVAYIVAENDNFDAIAARLCVGPIWLYWVNAVRRDGDGETLFVGDTLNLDAHTIHSVGDQNGVVYENELPENFRIPPQR